MLNAVMAVNGHTKVRGADAHGVEHEIDLAEPWTRDHRLRRHLGDARHRGHPADLGGASCAGSRDAADVPYETKWGHGQIVLEMFERLLEDSIVTPTFVMDYPTEVSPLLAQHRSVDPRLAEKWDLVIFGPRSAPRTPSWSTRSSSASG